VTVNQRYTIRKKIAQGGMAEVFVATQAGADAFERLVVLKRILPAYSAQPQFRNMLVDEAHIVMALNHGNIVPVLDLAHRDGWYFLVMELVDGWDLATILWRAQKAHLPLPLGLALHLTAEVCRGLAYAHACTSASGRALGIVHRDISPQNVLLSEHGEVRVTDFGIAKALGKRTRTEAGVVKGNVDFMSPEQAAGAAVDASSDVFSTGAMFYQLITGRLPFRAATELDTLHRVQKAEFTPAEEANPQLSPAVAGIVKKAMQHLPSQRYRGAREMMLELEEVLRTEFRAPSTSELQQWLAELGRSDGELPASKRPGLPMDEKTMTLDAGDILSVEEVSKASPPAADDPSTDALADPPPAPAAPAKVRRAERGRALVALAFLVVVAAAATRMMSARHPDRPSSQPTRALTSAPMPLDSPPKRSSAPTPPGDDGPRDPPASPTVTRKPVRANKQKTTPVQKTKTVARRKAPAKLHPPVR
jgi:serine/threonine-protein kinase